VALRRFLAVIAAFTLVALLLAAWFLPDSEDFRVANRSWNGLSGLDGTFSFRPLASLDDLPAATEGSTLVIIPYLDFTAPQLEKLGRYVARGGSLILADDYGYGNRLLAHLGLRARFSGQVLLDPLVNYKNEYFPRVVRFEPDPVTDGLDSLVLDHATSLTGTDAADVLALSSSFSFLDDNGSGARDDGEPAGPLPVVARTRLGQGRVVIVADPSIFINSITPLGDNARFIQNLADASPALYIDQSHLDASELGLTRGRLKAARGVLAGPPGTVLVVAAAVIIVMLPVWRREKRPNMAALVQKYLSNFLERRRP
jgi:hypothetical protein